MALTQTHFRFRTDANAVDATPTWGADEDASPSPATTPFRLRLGVYGSSSASGEFEIYAQKNAGSYAAVTTTATGGIQAYDASSDADDTALSVPRLTLSAAWWLAGAAIDLDFAGNRIYPSGVFTDYLSCSRASIGYAKNADGTLTQFSTDTLRIGVGTGLLVEDARTNTVKYSQDFSGADWQLTRVTLSTGKTAPDLTTTATKIIPTVDSETHTFQQGAVNPAHTADVPCTASFFAKADGYSWCVYEFYDPYSNADAFIKINLSNGATSLISNSGWTSLSFSTEAMGDGWWRFVVTGTSTGTAVRPFFQIWQNETTNIFAGDGTSGIQVWGIQLEDGAFASSYVPTTTAATARAADVLTHVSTLQTDIAATVGSIVAQINNGKMADSAANIVDSDGTNLLGFDATNHGLASIAATLATGNTANRTTRDKLGIAWNASGRSLVLNGGTVATDATAQTPSSTQHLGSSGTDKFAFACIERLTAWTSKLTDAGLQGFTGL